MASEETSSSKAEVSSSPSTLAEKLDLLFRSIPKEDGELYTNESAAAALSDRGIKVTGQHLWHLRSGRRDNPSFRLLEGIARLFGVPIAYFSDTETERQVAEELELLAAVRQTGVKSLLARTQGVSPANVERVSEILEQIRQMEGLD